MSASKLKTSGATVRTILLDDFTSLAIVAWVCLLITTLGDLFARTDLSVWKKAAWAVAVLAVPMGSLAYMAVQSRAITDRKAARLSTSDHDPQSAGSSSLSDEIGEVDRLVPMLQHAIEITGILEADHLSRVTAEPNQVGICEKACSEPVYAPEPNQICPDSGDSQRVPAVLA